MDGYELQSTQSVVDILPTAPKFVYCLNILLMLAQFSSFDSFSSFCSEKIEIQFIWHLIDFDINFYLMETEGVKKLFIG